jgi:hypothetical protein
MPAADPPRRITITRVPFDFEHSRISVQQFTATGEFLLRAPTFNQTLEWAERTFLRLIGPSLGSDLPLQPINDNDGERSFPGPSGSGGDEAARHQRPDRDHHRR